MKPVILGVLVLGIAAYFFSDPFQASVDGLFTDATTWTPANITADPEGYLAWAIGELDGSRAELKARRLAHHEALGKVSRERELRQAEAEKYEKVLGTLKAAYRQADEAQSWPATVEAKSVERDDLVALIIEADEKLARRSGRVIKCAAIEDKVADELAVIDRKFDEIDEMKRDLAWKRDEIELDKTLQDIESISDNFASLRDSAEALTFELTSGNELTLDELLDSQDDVAAHADRELRFDEIMSGH